MHKTPSQIARSLRALQKARKLGLLRSIRIAPGRNACEAARSQRDIEYLGDAVPRLPLTGCGRSRCECEYLSVGSKLLRRLNANQRHRLKEKTNRVARHCHKAEWLSKATRLGLLSLHHSAIGHTRASVQFPSEKFPLAAFSTSSSETVAVRNWYSDSDDVRRSQSRSILFGMSHPPMCHRSLRLDLKNS